MTDAPTYQADGRYQLPLYVTDGEIARRMGVGVKAGRKAIQQMRQHPRFPPPKIGLKRYWPAVVDFLDLWHGRVVDVVNDPAAPTVDHLERLQDLAQRLGRKLDADLASDPVLQKFMIEDDERRAKGGHRRPGMEKTHVSLAEHRLKQSLHNKRG